MRTLHRRSSSLDLTPRHASGHVRRLLLQLQLLARVRRVRRRPPPPQR
jgi:hypothetical protein